MPCPGPDLGPCGGSPCLARNELVEQSLVLAVAVQPEPRVQAAVHQAGGASAAERRESLPLTASLLPAPGRLHCLLPLPSPEPSPAMSRQHH